MLFNKTHEMPTRETALPGRAEPVRTDEVHYVNGRPLKGPHPEGFETAVFGMGCFWGVERIFWQLPGVWVTAAGYSGGHTPNPTYEETCTGRTGHTEVVQVVFNPHEISYAELLKAFWENHDPTQGMRQGNDLGTTYRSAIYYHSPQQDATARASKDKLEAERRFSRPIVTEITPAATFYPAEDYHQQYLEKRGMFECH